MKRFAAHYLYAPDQGYLKQYVVELDREGWVSRYFPLRGEVESVVWLPGVIILSFEQSGNLQACHLYPFDFEKMEPTPATQKRTLP